MTYYTLADREKWHNPNSDNWRHWELVTPVCNKQMEVTESLLLETLEILIQNEVEDKDEEEIPSWQARQEMGGESFVVEKSELMDNPKEIARLVAGLFNDWDRPILSEGLHQLIGEKLRPATEEEVMIATMELEKPTLSALIIQSNLYPHEWD